MRNHLKKFIAICGLVFMGLMLSPDKPVLAAGLDATYTFDSKVSGENGWDYVGPYGNDRLLRILLVHVLLLPLETVEAQLGRALLAQWAERLQLATR